MRNDEERLLDMLEMCDLLLAHASDLSVLATDPVVQAAAQRWVEVLGEAASHLSDELRSAHPEVPWREIIGTRVILAHAYFHVDQDIIGNVVERDIPAHVRRTDLVISEPISERTGATIAIKAEHAQRSGSFKIRGAMNVVHRLDEARLGSGIVTASSGNHGIAIATAAFSRDVPCTIFLPNGASPSKVAAIERVGAEIVAVDSTDAANAESAARSHAAAHGLLYVSPYNDADVIAGQGTIAVEILDDAAAAGMSSIDAVVVAVGGGGLISGIATWFDTQSPHTKLIGASPLNDQAMRRSVARGRISSSPSAPTYSDGTAGGIDSDAITFEICRRLVDDWIDVTEIDIARAVADMIDDHHVVVEGAAGVALAAASQYAATHPSHNIVAVSCGANISAATLRDILAEGRPRTS